MLISKWLNASIRHLHFIVFMMNLFIHACWITSSQMISFVDIQDKLDIPSFPYRNKNTITSTFKVESIVSQNSTFFYNLMWVWLSKLNIGNSDHKSKKIIYLALSMWSAHRRGSSFHTFTVTSYLLWFLNLMLYFMLRDPHPLSYIDNLSGIIDVSFAL